MLEAQPAAIKHIIVLSDGRLYDGRGPFSGNAADFAAMARRGSTAGITTSTIAMGADADFEQLRNIATAGNGRYYEALDVSTLPRIFTSEAMVATRSLLREERFSHGAATPITHERCAAGNRCCRHDSAQRQAAARVSTRNRCCPSCGTALAGPPH